MSLSQTTVVGRLTKKPEGRQVAVQGQEQTVANFSIACDRDFGEGTDFYDVVVWRKLAENVVKYLDKGREVVVVGRFQKRNYEATVPGTEVKYSRDVWELHADKVQFLGSANQSGGQQQASQQSNQQQNQQAAYSGNAPF